MNKRIWKWNGFTWLPFVNGVHGWNWEGWYRANGGGKHPPWREWDSVMHLLAWAAFKVTYNVHRWNQAVERERAAMRD